MKVSFWSNANEKCISSANLAAVSVACAIRSSYSIITMENHLCRHNLGRAYKGGVRGNTLDDPGTNYYDGSGMEGLLRKIYRGETSPGILKSYLLEIIHQHLYYIPQSRILHSEIFDYEFVYSIEPLLHMIEENTDLCFIDTASNNNLSTKTILEESDLIVVNLCQKSSVLEDFFLNYSSLLSKSVFIISHYNPRSIYTVKQISNQYNVPSERIIPFPENERYDISYRNGAVYEFISRNINCTRENTNHLYVQAVKKATSIILKRADALAKQKELILCGR